MEKMPLHFKRHLAIFSKNAPLVSFIYKDNQDKMQSALREVRKRFGEKHPLYIGGEKVWTDNLTPSVSPAEPSEIVGYGTEAGIPEAERAVKAARAAFETWRWTPVGRAGAFARSGGRHFGASPLRAFGGRSFEIAKAWSEADADIREAIDFCRFYAQQMRRLGRPKTYPNRFPAKKKYHQLLAARRRVCDRAVEFPIAILCGMAAAAVVTGNTVIMKPSEQSIICGAMLMQIFEEAGVSGRRIEFSIRPPAL